jgi:hypothetical protein
MGLGRVNWLKVAGTGMSFEAYRITLVKRALARTDAELFGNRWRYVKVAQRLAAVLLSPK